MIQCSITWNFKLPSHQHFAQIAWHVPTHLGARADSCSHALGGFDRFENSVAIAFKIKRNTRQRSCRYRKKRHDGKNRLRGHLLVAGNCAEETSSVCDCFENCLVSSALGWSSGISRDKIAHRAPGRHNYRRYPRTSVQPLFSQEMRRKVHNEARITRRWKVNSGRRPGVAKGVVGE